jgi:hypothetical protein
VDLSRWRNADANGQPDADTLRAATDTIMACIAEQLAELRGEPPPAEVWDPTAQAYAQRRTA